MRHGCKKHFLFPFCCSYQVYRYLAGCFGLTSCRHYLTETASAHNNPKKDGRTRAPALELLNPNRTICALDFSERIHYNIKEFGVQPQTDFFKSVEAYRSGHNGLDSKSSDPEMGPWVRIPPLPPTKSSCFDTKHEDFFLHL